MQTAVCLRLPLAGTFFRTALVYGLLSFTSSPLPGWELAVAGTRTGSEGPAP